MLCIICIFSVIISGIVLPAEAESITGDIVGKMASVYGYSLNDLMSSNGVISTEHPGDSLIINGSEYPDGVIYADIVNFDNNENPYLVILNADSADETVNIHIYGYDEDKQESVAVATLSKKYNTDPGVVGQFCLGRTDESRYIIYKEYTYDKETNAQYYTVVNGTAFIYVNNPSYAETFPLVSFNSTALRPEIDVSWYNAQLDEFFSDLKDSSADSVTYTDISEFLTEREAGRIDSILYTAAGFIRFDLSSFSDREEYEEALQKPDTDNKYYLLTHLYDLGDELYYARFSSNHSFYNLAVLRRSDEAPCGYQLLLAKTDSIPLSDIEIKKLKDIYTHNKLVMKKAPGAIDLVSEPVLQFNKLDFKKPISLPKIFDDNIRKSAAYTGGGIGLILVLILWVYTASGKDE